MENLESLEKLRGLINMINGSNENNRIQIKAIIFELDRVQMKIRDFKDLKSVDFKTASLPLIKYLSENHHPHVTAIVTSTSTELLEGKESHPKIYDFIVD